MSDLFFPSQYCRGKGRVSEDSVGTGLGPGTHDTSPPAVECEEVRSPKSLRFRLCPPVFGPRSEISGRPKDRRTEKVLRDGRESEKH